MDRRTHQTHRWHPYKDYCKACLCTVEYLEDRDLTCSEAQKRVKQDDKRRRHLISEVDGRLEPRLEPVVALETTGKVIRGAHIINPAYGETGQSGKNTGVLPLSHKAS